MFDPRVKQAPYDPASFNLFEQSFSKKLIETNMFINDRESATQETKDVVESLSRLSPSILIGPSVGNYTTSPASSHSMPSQSTLMFMHSPKRTAQDPEERKREIQERNRLAAVRSRLKKKQEWYRLLETEHLLRQENELLKCRIRDLESIVYGQVDLNTLRGPRAS